MEQLLRPLRADSLTDVFVSRFEELILSGKLTIGQRLPSERELALMMKVSRPVVHEGLVVLGQKGLVTQKPRVGTVVADYRRSGSLTTLTSLLNYAEGTVGTRLLEDVLEMRRLLEVEAARLAARHRTAAALEEARGAPGPGSCARQARPAGRPLRARVRRLRLPPPGGAGERERGPPAALPVVPAALHQRRRPLLRLAGCPARGAGLPPRGGGGDRRQGRGARRGRDAPHAGSRCADPGPRAAKGGNAMNPTIEPSTAVAAACAPAAGLRQPKGLSPRIQWLRDYYFSGASRPWSNENTAWTTGTRWDVQFNELTFYIVPEVYPLMHTMLGSYRQAARPVPLPEGFWSWSIAERRAWFVREVMVCHLPQELLPGELIAGARFNVQTSLCLTEREQKDWNRRTSGKGGAREQVMRFHDHGYGNAGATSGHLVPGHERALRLGWKGVHEDLTRRLQELPPAQREGPQGAQLRAMLTAATMPRDLAARYAAKCRALAQAEPAGAPRRSELEAMAQNLDRVPWEPPRTFWEALQALWLNHMLIMSDENYPGPGVSFGRIDQYLLPYYRASVAQGMDRALAKELLHCFWVHCNTAYDAHLRNGNQGITAGFGQLLTLGGLGPDGEDASNELTFLLLEVLDEASPILEPKPNVRLHRRSPEKLLDTVVEMIASSQGAPFLLNFDERSMAGLLREARLAGLQDVINEKTVWDYAPVGCLENTMVGNDRSGTVDNNLNLLKAVELALGNGKDLVPARDALTGAPLSVTQDGPVTGDPTSFRNFDQLWDAYAQQTRYLVERCVAVHEASEAVRADYFRTPYLSCLVEGCAEKGLDITQGGARISLTTLEAVTFATTVDSLLAVQYLVFEQRACSMAELIRALKDNWSGHEVLQAMARNKAPKYGRDDDRADALGRRVMELWTELAWKQRTRATGRRYRPGMLSWNYWAGDAHLLAASADGRCQGRFLSNAICPSNGADLNGPTSNANSVGKVLGGRDGSGAGGDWQGYVNLLPNGASHTMTFNPAMLRDPEHCAKFKAFLRGYAENGGTALQINMLDPAMLKDAQARPQEYRHLLVRVTGYNAYFTAIGRELQDEVIARLSHERL
ncbi:MAG: pyruvate formate lyase family protein [Myxococcales bacterium]